MNVPLNPFAEVEERELTNLGQTDDGLHRFDVRGWLMGETFDPWNPDQDPTAIAPIQLSTTRNTVEVGTDGLPRTLTVTYAFDHLILLGPGEGALEAHFSDFGHAVDIEAPPLNTTSA